jgi:hypothetical protein
MSNNKATIPQLAEEYTAVVAEAGKFGYLVRDTELQQEQVDILLKLKDRIKAFKYGAIKAGNEEAANTLFHLQCGLNAQISFLTIWIFIKKGDYYAAWDSLIDAEEYVSIAMKAADGGFGLEEFLDRLKRVEEIVFPGYNVYSSCGAIIQGGLCTVCGKPFSDCDHIEGLVYWGRLCVRVNWEVIKLDHIAVVDEPRDRRCVITELTTDDGWCRDYMTWRKTKEAEDPKEGTLGSFVSRVFDARLLEID